ncbi:MAG: NAD(P)H-binding protein [Bacteroidia bacterium]|nr:NAD(P)H-binding protein [Bacteroidia bacterium]
MKYVITGATGNTGKRIAAQLLAAGHEVVAISRQEAHLAELTAQGAIPAAGSLDDAAFLSHAFAGADAVYALIPPNFQAPDFRAYQRTIGEAIVSALKTSGVHHVVTLSSYGAHRPDTGVVGGLYDFEQLLARELPEARVLHLRAGFFMENFFGMIPAVQQAGVLGGFPLPADQPMAVVTTQDIAEVAARRLQALDFSGHSHVSVAHAQLITLREAAAILGAAIGKPELPYVQFPDEQFRAIMQSIGASGSLIDGYLEFGRAAASGALSEGTDIRPGDGTPTSLHDFAPAWAGAYAQASAAQPA